MNFKPLSLHPDMTPLQGMGIEWVITTSLVFIIAGALDERNRKVFMPGLPVGMAVGAGILCAVSSSRLISKGHLNRQPIGPMSQNI